MTDKLPFTDAATDPAAKRELETLIGIMRGALAPIMHAADDEGLTRVQGVLVTAASMLAGMTVGHQLACGVIDASKGHVHQYTDAAGKAFIEGIEQGRAEAFRAMMKMPGAGRA